MANLRKVIKLQLKLEKENSEYIKAREAGDDKKMRQIFQRQLATPRTETENG